MAPQPSLRMCVLFSCILCVMLLGSDLNMLGTFTPPPPTPLARNLSFLISKYSSEGEASAYKGPVAVSLVVGDLNYKLPFYNKACYFGGQGVPWYLVFMTPAECPKATYCKPYAVQVVMAATRRDVIVTDMDIVVKETGTSIKSLFGNYTDGADIVMTDHNIALNNGVIYIRNTAMGNVFVQEWRKLMEGPDRHFPFTDNGAIIDLMITMNPAWRSKHVLLPPPDAGGFLESRMSIIAEIAGPFTGQTDRAVPISADAAAGGAQGWVRLVRPSHGFNSHRCNQQILEKWGWQEESCFHDGMAWLHTKDFEKEVDPQSTACPNLPQWPINPLSCGHAWDDQSRILEIWPAYSRPHRPALADLPVQQSKA